MKRRACAQRGHRWREYLDGFRPPVQFCGRWFCDGARADPLLPEPIRAALQHSIERR